MYWAYGITTVANRGDNLLKQTVESLARAGFDSPYLFVDGLNSDWKPPGTNLSGVIIHEPGLGHQANWMNVIFNLYILHPKAERYVVFEDDLIATKGLKEYLEKCTFPEKSYLNLVTHADNLAYIGPMEGWHRSNQRGRGAVGLVFDRQGASDLIRSKPFTDRSHFTKIQAADAMVIESLGPQGYTEWVHNPTLLQHVGGGQSTMKHKWGEMLGWKGEDYDLTPLLAKQETVKMPPTPEEITLNKLILPSKVRPTVWRGGVIQIHVTRACDKACFNCTQGSNLGGKSNMISLEAFEAACYSLRDYWGIVGMFGGNPATHPQFEELCSIIRSYVPRERRGLWCNHPRGKGAIMRETFNPAVSNLNVHLDREAFDEFKRDWPESAPFGLENDSRHSPPFVAMLDVIPDENERWKKIGDCDINRLWSAMIAEIPGKGLRGYFCEIAGSMAIVHANDEAWPDTGVPVNATDSPAWWQLPMSQFADQVRWNCHRCGIPLKLEGQLAVGGKHEEVSATHADVYKSKVKGREVELVQLDAGPSLGRVTDYIQNAR